MTDSETVRAQEQLRYLYIDEEHADYFIDGTQVTKDHYQEAKMRAWLTFGEVTETVSHLTPDEIRYWRAQGKLGGMQTPDGPTEKESSIMRQVFAGRTPTIVKTREWLRQWRTGK